MGRFRHKIFFLSAVTVILLTSGCPTHTPTSAPTAPNLLTILSRPQKIEQLIGDYDRQYQAPTRNLTGQRYQLYFTDLGVCFHHGDRWYLLFGDIPPKADDPIAYTLDTDLSDGLDLTFIKQNLTTYRPVEIPGVSLADFEVPMEGVSVDGHMYLYATTGHTQTVTMGRSVVAVSDDDGRTFTRLYDFSSSHFINVSIVETDVSLWPGFPDSEGDGLVIFGSGSYRASDVYLAYQPAASIAAKTNISYFKGFDASYNPLWSSSESDAVALFSHPVVGELSVSYNSFIGRWLMLYNAGAQVIIRSAEEPWGPWTAAQVLYDPWTDDGYGEFIHISWTNSVSDSLHDQGRENEWGGVYGPYQFPDHAAGNSVETTIYFTMSTWNPYTVVLMGATLGIE